MTDSHIDVTICGQGLAEETHDMRIPKAIETKRLIQELENIFHCRLCQQKYQLRVVNKGLLLDEGKVLADYPITTGDTIEIMKQ